MSGSKSGLGPDQDQTNLDGPWRSQNVRLGPDCPVSGPAKMAPDRTRPNFPNTSAAEANDSSGSEGVGVNGYEVSEHAWSGPETLSRPLECGLRS